MTAELRFSATLEKVPTEGGWYIVRLPDDIVQSLRREAGKKGNIPIKATTGKTTWPTTIMSMGNQQWFIAISVEVRKNENLQEGDSLSVVLAPDWTRLKNEA